MLVLIIIGLGLLATQKLWVPGLVNQILTSENNNTATIHVPAKTGLDTTTWQTFSDRATGVTFKYPATLPTVYIHTQNWPPKVAVTNSKFSCTPSGKEITQAGQTTKQTINGVVYCITKGSEGAAGSIYINYTYATEIQNKFVILTFTIREVQCANYSDPQMTACNKERASFNIDPTVDQMFQTFHIL